MIFFDNSFVDLSLSARWMRQERQIKDKISFLKAKVNIYNKIIWIKWFIRSLKPQNKLKVGQGIAVNYALSGKDPTIDQYIQDKGGILCHADNKVYYNKRDYLAVIKESGCHIKDY